MLWIDISMQGKTDMYIVQNGTLTAARYVNEILDVYVRQYAVAIGSDFILMDDNARLHKVWVTNEHMQTTTIVRIDWPARSPELNENKIAWDILLTAICAPPVQPTSSRAPTGTPGRVGSNPATKHS